MTPFDPGVPFQDTAVAGFESGAAAKAFASLPERWQLVLWHLEVEGQKPADIAPLLGHERQLRLRARLPRPRGAAPGLPDRCTSPTSPTTDCRWVNEHLGAFVRKGLSKRDSAKVQAHLDECRRCTAMYLELTEVNSNLAGIIAPLLLGAAASGYLASSGAGAAGVLGLLSRAKDFVAANTGAVTAAGVAAAVATAAAVAAVTLSGGGGPKNVVADPPAAVTTPAAPAPSVATKTPATTPATAPGKPAAVTTAPVGPVATPAQTPAAPVTDFTNVIPSLPGSPSATDSAGTGTDVTAPSSVDLSGTTIDDRGVHFRAVGSPALPPTLTVRLLSDPGGVVFTQAGNDCAVSDNGLSAVCSTISGSGARSPGTAKMLASSSYSAELPFDQDAGPDNADVSIAIAPLPDGFELSGADGSGGVPPLPSRPAKVRQVDAAFDLDAARVGRPPTTGTPSTEPWPSAAPPRRRSAR